jgi:hypothetical protein
MTDDLDGFTVPVANPQAAVDQRSGGSSVSRRLEDEDIQEFIARTHVHAAERLLEITPSALDAIHDIITDINTPPSVRQKAAADVLDRVGLKQSIKVEVSGEVGIAPSEIISERLAALAGGQAALTAALAEHDTIDIDPDDIDEDDDVTGREDAADPGEPDSGTEPVDFPR